MSALPHGAGREAGGSPLPDLRLAAAGSHDEPPAGARATAGWFAAALAVLGLFAAAALVGRDAGLGVAVLGVALVAAAAVAIGRRDAWTVAWWVLAAALAATPALRDAAWVWFPCVAGAALVASLAAAGGGSGRQVVVGLLAGLRWLPLGPSAALAPLARTAAGADRRVLWPALRGGLLAAVLLAIFVPLFTAADAAFAEIVDRAVPDDVVVDNPVGRVLALVLVVAAGGALLRAAAAGPARPARDPARRLGTVEWAVALGALVALFAAFVAVQLTTLFGGHDFVLETTGLTYAEYARQGFGELVLAAGLTLAVIAAARRWGRPDRLLRVLPAALCVLTLVMLASALRRLDLYEEAYGFTRLRLAAHAHIHWLGAVLALVLAAVVTGTAPWLPRALVALSAAGAVAFALSNPDGRIAGHNVERYERGGRLDIAYLRGLSADAAPALARLPAGHAACATGRIRADLERDGALVEANAGRARAERALAGLPRPDLACER